MRGEAASAASSTASSERRELGRLFLRLGLIAFGGPAAHIAMMEDEVVKRRGWLSHESFLDMISACNLMPGPNSTEMALHVGQRRAGFVGLLIGGFSFMLPAVAITTALAWAYVRFGSKPEVANALYGIKPVIIAIVVQAIWRLGRSVLHNGTLIAVTAAATVAAFAGLNEMILLVGGGLLMALICRVRQSGAIAGLSAAVAAARTSAAVAIVPFSLTALFLIFLKIGAIMFGSGYVLLAFLQNDFVTRTHWLTQAQLLDAVAIGQITPGPLSSTATFVGYLLGGVSGAALATVGIFLPAFCLVTLSGPLLVQLRHSPLAGTFLDGVNAASLALMIDVTWQLGRAAIVDYVTVALAIISAVLLLRFRLNSVWLIALGGAAGAATSLFN